MVLVGEDGEEIRFLMPEIPLIGSCWSNFVAQKMLNGQMYLKFVFDVAKSTLEFCNETNRTNCQIIACDNCFYAPYLYFYKDKGENTRVYVDYLIKEYPKAYEWLQNREENENFYNDFYIKYVAE